MRIKYVLESSQGQIFDEKKTEENIAIKGKTRGKPTRHY